MSSVSKHALLTDAAVGFRNCGTPEAQGFCPRIPFWRYSIGRFRCRLPAERRSPSGSAAHLVTAVKSRVELGVAALLYPIAGRTLAVHAEEVD